MKDFYTLLDHLIDAAIQEALIEQTDRIYCRNRLLALWGKNDYTPGNTYSGDMTICHLLDKLVDLAASEGIIEDTLSHKDRFGSSMMSIFLPAPSIVNERFAQRYQIAPTEATSYFYKLSQDSNYIKTSRIAQNKSFSAPSPYGPITLTINLSKPEKDPKQIALEKTLKPSTYPTCLLCVENEGYDGTQTHPDRANHRMIRLTLNEKNWMLQYSPYLYYDEHCILLSEKHEPMCIGQDTFKNLLSFVKVFPHYFLGSNADLPIVGGSILSHEHYQGGLYHFPMNGATTLFSFKLEKFPTITGEVLNWPLSTIRLSSTSIQALVDCSTQILEFWRTYSDPSCKIHAYTLDTPHNTITPIAHFEDGHYVMDLVLRNNRTTDEHPSGLFHPHADVHHIKKENIGLIEVMGLAILPGRLLSELDSVKAYIKDGITPVATYHQPWADTLRSTYTENIDLDRFVEDALGSKFVRVLEDAGVFKLDESGIAGFKHFTDALTQHLA
ncbi:MAG: UDP-glucose--hexose-1-phosphate uridylyltransferase [Cellulosilyticaceae bacterium]